MTSTSPGLSGLPDLPDDLIGAIASYLSPNEIITLCQTCRAISISDALKETLLSDPNAFRKAVLSNRPDIISSLLERGLDPAFESNWAIRQACAMGHTDIVRLLLTCDNVDPTVENDFAFKIACAEGHIDVVKILLERGNVIPESSMKIALRNACFYKRAAVVELLIKSNKIDLAKCGAEGLLVIWKDRKSGDDIDLARMLLSDPRVDVNNTNLVSILVSENQDDFLRLVLEDPRVDLSPYDEDRELVITAAGNGDNEVLRVLLDDPRIKMGRFNGERGALGAAINGGHVETVKILLADDKHEYQRDYINSEVNDLLNAGYISREILELILKDERFDPSNSEILDYAAEHCGSEMVERLLKDSRIDPSKNDNSAIRIAAERLDYVMTVMLLEDKRVYETIDKKELLHIRRDRAAAIYRRQLRSYFRRKKGGDS